MTDDDLLDLTIEKLRRLKMPGMAKELPELLKRAIHENLSMLAVVSALADAEHASRTKSAIDRRIRTARFPEINTVDAFDFDFDTERKKLRTRYLALHDLTFLSAGVNPLFIGNPGTGKTFLARALAYKACTATRRVVFVAAAKMLNELHGAQLHGDVNKVLRKYTHADLLVVDDFASLAMDSAQANLAFQVISERYDHRRSTSITTNRPFADWPKVFPDALNAQVIAERLSERCEHFVLKKGYRIQNRP